MRMEEGDPTARSNDWRGILKKRAVLRNVFIAYEAKNGEIKND